MGRDASAHWRAYLIGFALALSATALAQTRAVHLWSGYGGNAQHTAQSRYAGGALNVIKWQTPLDTNPTYRNGDILIHYGEPGITSKGNVLLTCKHGDNNPFTIEAHRGTDGGQIWSYTSSYVLPTSDWTPSMGLVVYPGPPAVTIGSIGLGGPSGTTTIAAWPESGGRIAIRSDSDTTKGSVTIHAFYGDANYAANQAAMDANVQVCTPITAGPDGSLYFGYYVVGSNPLNLTSGLAVLRPNGTGSSVGVAALSGDSSMNRVSFNCAPALSNDGSTVYEAVSAGDFSGGYLTSASTAGLTPIAHVLCLDPSNNKPADVSSISTACPMVAPDNTVYFGVLENTFDSNNDRGWLLHYSADLSQTYTPGSFGWDFTPSIVPASVMPDGGTSSYYIACKYNNYVGQGTGDGQNKIGLLDPSLNQFDSKHGINVMYEVETLLGQTPNSAGGFYEWCINSIAIDVPNQTAICNSEDGTVYAWNLATNKITSKCKLTAGIGEAYTSTFIAPNGTVFAISNGILFAINSN